MHRKKFGKIVQKLRKQTTLFTQAELNERLNLPQKTIERIEQGVTKKIDADLLMRLADEFCLVTAERKEFLFAALSTNNETFTVDDAAPMVILNELVATMETIDLPAFINDVYGDLVAMNTFLLKYFNAEDIYDQRHKYVEESSSSYNLMRWVFDEQFGYKQMMGPCWHKNALDNMRYFRRISLRYMGTMYYDMVYEALDKYPLFTEYWKQTLTKNPIAGSEQSDIIKYDYYHPLHGAVQYVAMTSMVVTPAGELYYVQYVPTDDKTRTLFNQIKMETPNANQVHYLSAWPDKVELL